jgi:hypothetical protein
MLKIDIYEADGKTLYLADVDIREIGDDESETCEARKELSRNGEAWIGGGASPRLLLKLKDRPC